MNEPQTIIDNIKAAIEVPESVPADRLAQLASEYAECCKEIGGRLEYCSRYLRMGNPCEAIRLAESTPPLLDLCNIVDFPERDEWISMCKSLGLEVAPALSQSIRESLEDAYNLVTPCEDLLKRHRLLALVRAPLRKRLDVLYKLDEAQPGNIVWTDMIAQYESARLEEIVSELARARQERTTARVVPELLKELESTSWRNPPASSLIESLRTITKEAATKQNVQQFRALADNFHLAVSQNDIPRARHWQDQWNTRLRSANIRIAELPEDIQSIYQTASRWFVQLERKNKVTAELHRLIVLLEQAIRTETEPEELESVYQNVVDFADEQELTIPPDVVLSYSETRKALLAEKMKWRLLIGISIFVIVALVIVLVLVGVRNLVGSVRIGNSAARLVAMFDEYEHCDPDRPESLGALERIETTLAALDKSDPRCNRYSQIAQLKERLAATKKADAARSAQFGETLARAQRSLEPDTQGGVNPDPALLAQVKKLVRTESEHAAWVGLNEAYDKAVRLLAGKEQNQIVERADALKNRLAALLEDHGRSEADVDSELSAVASELAVLTAPSRRVPLSKHEEEILQNELTRVRDFVAGRRQLNDDMNGLADAVGSRPDYAGALQKLEDKYRDYPFVADFTTVRAELGSQETLEAWNIFVVDSVRDWFAFANFVGKSQKFVTLFEKKKTGLAFVPEVARIADVVESYRSVLENGGRQKICAQLEKYFSAERKPLFVHIAQKESGNDYYYYTTSGTNRIPWSLRDDVKDAGVPSAELTHLPPVAQQTAIDEALSRLRPLLSSDDYSMPQWYVVIGSILRDFDPRGKDNMDPFVKLFYLEKIFAWIGADPIVARHFDDWQTTIRHAALDLTIDWTNPKTPALPAQRKLAVEILASLPSLEGKLAEVLKDVDDTVRLAAVRYEWVGFLVRRGQWQCQLVREMPRNGELYVFRAGNETGPRFIAIGEYADGKAVVRSDSNDLLRGQPVFVRVFLDPRTLSAEEI